MIKHRVYIEKSPKLVFDSITNGAEWNEWFTSECIIGKQVGDEINFVWKDYGIDHLDISDSGKIIEFDRPEIFGFTWQPGDSKTSVRLKLERRGTGTILSLEDTGYSDSLGDIEAFNSCSVGWGEALTLLKFYLEYGITYGKIP